MYAKDMRRVAVAALVGAAVLALAAPAWAGVHRTLRDPFQPLVTQASGGGGTGGTTTSTPAPAPSAPAVTTPGTLATTGTDPSPWLALAYVLVAAGAGGIVV